MSVLIRETRCQMASQYKQGCDGCQRSDGCGDVADRGGIIRLPGDWILNHYGGREGFLGWMALQPKFHREQLQDLKPAECKELGRAVRNIEEGLRKYWKQHFHRDPLTRMYVLYFSEYSEHLHFHLIARPKSIRELTLRRKSCNGYVEIQNEQVKVEAWNIYLATKCRAFPAQYKIWKDDEIQKAIVCPLMNWMRKELS